MVKYPELNEYRKVLTLVGEVWKDIGGFEDFYQVSNFGRIKGKGREIESSNQAGNFSYWVDERIIVAHPDSKGYPQVGLRKDPRRKRVARVHRIVAENFLGRKDGQDSVHHKDNDPMNAHVENLVWTTGSANLKYASEDGVKKYQSGVDHACSTLSQELVVISYLMAKEKIYSQDKIAEILDMKQITVSNIKTKKTWQHITNQIDEILGIEFSE